MLWGIVGLLIGQWQVGGGVLNARYWVTWQRGGQWQTGGILDAQRRVTWQSGGCEGSDRLGEASSMLDVGWCGKAEGAKAVADRGRHPWRSTSSDVAERRAGADRERHSRCLTSSDLAEWRVRAVGGEAGVHVVWEALRGVSEPGPHLLREGHGWWRWEMKVGGWT